MASLLFRTLHEFVACFAHGKLGEFLQAENLFLVDPYQIFFDLFGGLLLLSQTLLTLFKVVGTTINVFLTIREALFGALDLCPPFSYITLMLGPNLESLLLCVQKYSSLCLPGLVQYLRGFTLRLGTTFDR